MIRRILLQDGSELQNVSTEQAQLLFAEGKIGADTLILFSDDGEWTSLGRTFNLKEWQAEKEDQRLEKPLDENRIDPDPIPPQLNSEITGAESTPPLPPSPSNPPPIPGVKTNLISKDLRLAALFILIFAVVDAALFALATHFGVTLIGHNLFIGIMTMLSVSINLLIVRGLLKGSNGWRQFAKFRIFFSLLNGAKAIVISPVSGIGQILAFIGIYLLLNRKESSKRRRQISAGVAVVGLCTSFIISPIVGESILYETRTMGYEAYRLPRRKIEDHHWGYSIVLPNGWSSLAPGNPILAEPKKSVVLFDFDNEIYGLFLPEILSSKVVTAEEGLNNVMINEKNGTKTDYQEIDRYEPVIGAEKGKALVFKAKKNGQTIIFNFMVVRAGWRIYTLKTWTIDGRGDILNESAHALQNGISLDKSDDPQFLSPYVHEWQSIDPLLNDAACSAVASAADQGKISHSFLPTFLRIMGRGGQEKLPPLEQNEFWSLHRQAFSNLPPRDALTFQKIEHEVTKTKRFTPSQGIEWDQLRKKAFLTLPADKLVRAQSIYSEATKIGTQMFLEELKNISPK
jgi:hypothetical protein